MIQLPASVSRSQNDSGLVYFDVSHARCQARIYQQGAQLVHYQAAGQVPLLWVSSAEPFKPGAAIRGGIPVCWPWFGAHPAGKGPAHGLARSRDWQLVRAAETEQGVSLVFGLVLDEPPYTGLTAELKFELGAELQVSLASINRSQDTQQLSLALHSYFAIGDIGCTRLHGAGGRHYSDSLSGAEFIEQQTSLVFDREIDRIYYGSGEWTLECPTLHLRLSSAGSDSTVVWNPWQEKSGRLSHFKADDYLSMVCVETANCGHDSLSLAPGEQHVTGVCYRYLPLAKFR